MSITWWNWVRISPLEFMPSGHDTTSPFRVPPRCEPTVLVQGKGASSAQAQPVSSREPEVRALSAMYADGDNVDPADFPQEFRDLATSLCAHLAGLSSKRGDGARVEVLRERIPFTPAPERIVFSEREAGEVFGHQQPSQIRISLEANSVHIMGFPFRP